MLAIGLVAMALVAAPGRAVALTSCNPATDNPCPDAVDDSYKTTIVKLTSAGSFDVPAPGVLANDSGPHGTIVSVPDSDTTSFWGNATIDWHGTTTSGGHFTYTPDPATPFTGVDTFDYEIHAGSGDSMTFADATVSLEIDPVVHADSYSTPQDTELDVPDPGVLGNDIGVGDINNYDSTSKAGGTVVIADDGALTYTPPAGFCGLDTFKYTIDDINVDNTFDGTVSVQVGGCRPPPPPPPPPPKPKPVTTPPPAPPGYWMVGTTGHVYAFGALKDYGSASTFGVTHLEPTPTHHGYWIVNSMGHVSALGDAHSYGDAGALTPGERVTSLSSTHSGKGYWLFTDLGRVFPRGDAKFYGDMHLQHLNEPVVGSIATSSGKGYYMVASDGGIFSFGDAVFHGSTGNRHLNKPVNGLVPTASGKGYWLVASDGGIFTFGDAHFRGSMGGVRLNKPVIGMVRYGNGYLMVGSDGGIFSFSNRAFVGSLGNAPPPLPIVGVASSG
jgi:hypothetical protein